MLEDIHYIAIEGPIGVGKTTLATALAERLGATTLFEEAEENPFLGNYYDDPRRYAFQAQIFFLVSRFKQQQQLGQNTLFEPLVISDYLFDKDRLFARLTLSEDEWMLYERLQPLLSARIRRPDLVVLLQATTDALMERIRRRGKKAEQRMTREYVEKIVEAYDQFFFTYDACPVLVVNTSDVDFTAPDGDFENLVRRLDQIKAGRQYYVPVGR
jgi:deoxyadenosine/deoxycytidine kinase